MYNNTNIQALGRDIRDLVKMPPRKALVSLGGVGITHSLRVMEA